MTDPDEPSADAVPPPAVRTPRRWAPNLVWLVPLVAVIAAALLVVRSYLAAGPTITITFKTAEGLDAGKTEVKYRDVVVGRVTAINLSEDRDHVVVKVDLTADASGLAVEGSKFWIARPRVDMAGVSGLGTLISGAYVGVDGGDSTVSRKKFEGLEVPPAVTSDRVGKRFVLNAADLGSLSIGSPIYLRRVAVGRIVGYELAKDGKGVSLQGFVDAPNDVFVNSETRFWNASGVDVSVKPSGLRVQAQSLATIIAGGIAFQNKDGATGGPVADGAAFKLYESADDAFALPDGDPLKVRMHFAQSTRGLSTGAPLDFRGVELGTVSAIVPQYDTVTRAFSTEVTAVIYPTHLGAAYDTLRSAAGDASTPPAAVFANMVRDGLRAQLKTANLITGQLYIAVEMDPKAPPVKEVAATEPLDIPTTPGGFDEIQMQVASIVKKIDAVPFDQIGRETRDTLERAQSLLARLETEVAPEATGTLREAQKTLRSTQAALSEDSGLQTDVRQTMTELERAARSLRALGDYLQRHPESLLRGKRENAEPVVQPPLKLSPELETKP
jgi:paraquat-inducible protein B